MSEYISKIKVGGATKIIKDSKAREDIASLASVINNIDTNNKITNGGGVATEVALTKAEYNALATKESNTVYIITDEPVENKTNIFKVCQINSNTTNISSLIQQYSLIPNNVVILTDLDENKTYEYTLNNTTKTFNGDSEHDLMFRYIGNNEFKPINFGI